MVMSTLQFVFLIVHTRHRGVVMSLQVPRLHSTAQPARRSARNAEHVNSLRKSGVKWPWLMLVAIVNCVSLSRHPSSPRPVALPHATSYMLKLFFSSPQLNQGLDARRWFDPLADDSTEFEVSEMSLRQSIQVWPTPLLRFWLQYILTHLGHSCTFVALLLPLVRCVVNLFVESDVPTCVSKEFVSPH